MIDVQKAYQYLCKQPSDINEHLSVLYEYGKKVNHITEFGVRSGISTIAFLYSKPQMMISYDINPCSFENFSQNFLFIQADVLNIKIQQTDLLFIDTLHTYTQLSRELKLHANQSKHFLIFHDTVTFGLIGQDRKKPGLILAIDEFMVKNPWWQLIAQYKNNNGLTVLQRN